MDIKPEDLGELVSKLGKLMQRPMHPKVQDYLFKLGTDASQAALGTGILIRGVKIKISAEFIPLDKEQPSMLVGLGSQDCMIDLSVITGADTHKVDAEFANKPISPLILGDYEPKS